MRLISDGLTDDEIAEALFLSVNTVESHVRSAGGRIGLLTRAQAVIWRFRNGLGERSSAPSQGWAGATGALL